MLRKSTVVAVFFVTGLAGSSGAMASRYMPGCDREALALGWAMEEIARGPVHTVIPMDWTDAPWNNGEWTKFAARYYFKESTWIPGWRLYYTIDIHYNRNNVTGQIADVKFKNNYSSGCTGRLRPEGSPHQIGAYEDYVDDGLAGASDGTNTSWWEFSYVGVFPTWLYVIPAPIRIGEVIVGPLQRAAEFNWGVNPTINSGAGGGCAQEQGGGCSNPIPQGGSDRSALR